MAITFQGSVLLVADMARSRTFYEQCLEQAVKENIEDINVSYSSFTLWERDYASSVIWGDNAPDQIHNQAMELYFECDDLPTLTARLNEHHVTWLQPLQEAPWGQLSMRIEDPDGNMVEIGEPISATVKRMAEQGMSAQQVAEKTGLPIDAVQAMYPQHSAR